MKKKKDKNDKKKNKSPKNEEIPKEIGVFNDFLVYDKEKKLIDNFEFQVLESSPSLKDGVIINRESKQTKSRFSELFEEINQDKKNLEKEDEKDKDDKKDQTNEIFEDQNIPGVEEQNQENKLNTNYTLNLNQDMNFLFSNNTFLDNKCIDNNFYFRNTFYPNMSSQYQKMSINSNLSYQRMSTTDTTLSGITNNLSSNSYNSNINNNINNINNSLTSSKINVVFDNKEQSFEPNVDIENILSLKDTRTTVMIKNIPNKFSRDLLLSTIDQNFKGTYDLFILPTDGNKNKNFGYSFINFISSYFIPYFYYLFNGKKWSSTNSQKICEITYSKVQGRDNLITHYPNKIIHFNPVINLNIDHKFIIPNEYKTTFSKIYPKLPIEEFKYYFVTKLPSK